MHEARIRRHGDPNAVISPSERKVRTGSDHPSWNSDPDYVQWHQRLRSIKGSASKHVCSLGCGKQAEHWAYIGTRSKNERGKFETNPDKYAPMCAKCHHGYDAAFYGKISKPKPSMTTWRAEAVRLYESGMGTVKIGRIVGRSPSVVFRGLKAEGVTLRPAPGK